MSARFFHYPACDTCRKARAFLDRNGIAYRPIQIVEAPPSVEELSDLVDRSGLDIRKFFNTSGESYRKGGFKERLPTLDRAQCLAALASDGKLLKRPILDTGQAVLVGFREEDYRRLVGSR